MAPWRPGYGRLIVDRLHLPAVSSSPSVARRFVRGALERAAFRGDRDGVVLMVSEVVTNAVLYAGEPIELVVDIDEAHVAVSVADGDGGHVPAVGRPAALGAVGGRGMAIVAALADAWGHRPVAPDAKAVWFTVALR